MQATRYEITPLHVKTLGMDAIFCGDPAAASNLLRGLGPYRQSPSALLGRLGSMEFATAALTRALLRA
ncbi:protein of unknown function [Acidithiobacillus ferrivorans]|uniref:Uncharacterized protein n=1 Tax=Acidithiobacillus ferrivorans TaxID=160808 RepID=A0A060UR27_9PROT|nr:hypothetical protein AFERRI_50022 [Acidithiobacillus ferrivorans]SMH64993.1 protein of unknown function [Acidithiobacillus ferrivorans]